MRSAQVSGAVVRQAPRTIRVARAGVEGVFAGPHYCTPNCGGNGRPPRRGVPAAAKPHALCWPAAERRDRTRRPAHAAPGIDIQAESLRPACHADGVPGRHAPVAAQAAPQAEIAIRWDPSQGGLAELHDAFCRARLTHAAPQFLVQYHAASQPDHAPPGFGAVHPRTQQRSGQRHHLQAARSGTGTRRLRRRMDLPLVGKAVVKYEIDSAGLATRRRGAPTR